MLATALIVLVAWSTIALSTAMLLGRRLDRVHRTAAVLGVGGVLLVLPALLLGTFGIPAGLSLAWFGVLLHVADVGMAAGLAGASAWLAADTAFVWLHRRRAFPFAYRAGPRDEG